MKIHDQEGVELIAKVIKRDELQTDRTIPVEKAKQASALAGIILNSPEFGHRD